MSKDAWRAFIAWLDTASDAELRQKHQRSVQLLEQITDKELASNLRRWIRLMEQEQVTRLGIAGRRQQSRRK